MDNQNTPALHPRKQDSDRVSAHDISIVNTRPFRFRLEKPRIAQVGYLETGYVTQCVSSATIERK